MPDENFFPKYINKASFSKEEMEELVRVKIDPKYTLEGFLSGIRKELPDHWSRFIVSPDFDLFLTTDHHSSVANNAGVNTKDCLIEDGAFEIDPGIKRIWFVYHSGPIARVPHIRKVAEDKIIEFLKSKGIEVKRP